MQNGQLCLFLTMFAATPIPYELTASFPKIILHYIGQKKELEPYYSFPPSLNGIQQAVQKKQDQKPDRNLLVEVLLQQYNDIDKTDAVIKNISALQSSGTFTVCTAHQPNLFTGPLYFIYKILHAIKLANYLKEQLPSFHFVPVFYMGSEDADFEELNHFTVEGKKYEWATDQKGAVGRMLIDKKIIDLIDELALQIGVEPHGIEFINLLRESYQDGVTIQSATFKMINRLFGNYGLIVLIADDARLKKIMTPVFQDDLFKEEPSSLVEGTCKRLREHYTVQAYPRNINLFYLKNDIRERIIKTGNSFAVYNTDVRFTQQELKLELDNYPERFSPNVILRGLFQEMILPNVAFIGGGGELAYWFQLKDLFTHYAVPFPVMILRNSFLIIENQAKHLIDKLGISTKQIFTSPLEILNTIIEKEGKKPQLNGELDQLFFVYEELKKTVSTVDTSLVKHIEALKVRSGNQLKEVEKKMLRTERKKHEAEKRQIAKLRQQLFPKNVLQERVENLSSFYARQGHDFINELYTHSLLLEQQFTVLSI
jgi:bacillithiol biosynthesis cysteine-adding enzyme BshC